MEEVPRWLYGCFSALNASAILFAVLNGKDAKLVKAEVIPCSFISYYCS